MRGGFAQPQKTPVPGKVLFIVYLESASGVRVLVRKPCAAWYAPVPGKVLSRDCFFWKQCTTHAQKTFGQGPF